MSTGRFWTRTTPFWGWDIFTGVPTSPRRYLWRRHLPRWRRRKWRQPRPGESFRRPLRRRRKMAAILLPVAILDDLICGTGNEVIQNGGRKRKGGHLTPPPQWGSKNSPYTTTKSAIKIVETSWSQLSKCGTSHKISIRFVLLVLFYSEYQFFVDSCVLQFAILCRKKMHDRITHPRWNHELYYNP